MTSLTCQLGYLQNYCKSQVPYIHCDFHSNLIHYILIPIIALAISHTLYHSLFRTVHLSYSLNVFSRVKHSLFLSSTSSPLCRVFILIFLRQTMSLGNTVLQLFCCFYSWCLLLLLLLLLLSSSFTAIEFSLGGNSPYTSNK